MRGAYSLSWLCHGRRVDSEAPASGTLLGRVFGGYDAANDCEAASGYEAAGGHEAANDYDAASGYEAANDY